MPRRISEWIVESFELGPDGKPRPVGLPEHFVELFDNFDHERVTLATRLRSSRIPPIAMTVCHGFIGRSNVTKDTPYDEWFTPINYDELVWPIVGTDNYYLTSHGELVHVVGDEAHLIDAQAFDTFAEQRAVVECMQRMRDTP